MAAKQTFRIWAAVAGLEAASRLFLQVITTAVLARLLTPADFGISTLILTVVTIFSVFVAVPFEDALAQRKFLRVAHISAALAASWLAALGFVVVAVGVGQLLAWFYHQRVMALLLPVASLLLFPSAQVVIVTAVARRYRKFNAVALSSLIANVMATVSALLLAWRGGGVWALVAYRVVMTFAQAAILARLMRLKLRPRWSQAHFHDLSRFARFVVWDRFTDNMTYLVFNYLVSSVFGLAELGRFNMALRVIEPIRGAMIAIAHNLNFCHFQPAARDPALLADRVLDACQRQAMLVAPVFFGIAGTAPVLIPVVVGPGWQETIVITQILAIGSACMLAIHPVQTGLVASGRPEYSLYASVSRLATVIVSILALSSLGVIGVAMARLTGDTSDTVVALVVADTQLNLRVLTLIFAVLRPIIVSAAMALLVLLAGSYLAPVLGASGALAVMVPLGVLLYAGLMRLFVPDVFRKLLPSGLDPQFSVSRG